VGLQLGKSFNRQYVLRIPFLDGYYNVGLFYNIKSSFLLFNVEPDFTQSKEKNKKQIVKINMFKNIEASKFCETFINLHNYRSQSLDIINQFKEIKPYYTNDVDFLFNESHIMSKIKINDSELYDTLYLYCFTLTSYTNEFLFLMAERHNIITKLKKKVVRTNAIQISTTSVLDVIDEYYNDMIKVKNNDVTKRIVTNDVINFNEVT